MAGRKRVRAMKPGAKARKSAKRSKLNVKASTLQSGAIAPALMGFPRTCRAKLCYRDSFISLNPTAGGLAANHLYSCNGLFDPDVTGVGHQCVGFDQYMAMYDHYVVLGAKIIATFTNQDASNRQTAVIYVDDTTSASTDLRVPIENGTCAFTELDVAAGTNAQKTLTLMVDPVKWQGRTNPLADPELKGTAAANPVEQCYFALAAAPHTVVDAASVGVNVTIYYDVIFFERRRTALS